MYMNNQKGFTILIIMVVVAVAALLFGFLVMRQRINTMPTSKTSSDTNPADSQIQDQPPQVSADLAGWKTYTNDKYSFQLQYPPALSAGAVSKNSVLGTFQVPVKGFHVGPLVLVVLKDASLKQQAFEYFDSYYQEALHPQSTMPPAEGGLPPSACTIEKIVNANVTNIRSVSCTGEGGAARYAYISGPAYDVFVDGYSKGYDTVDYGQFAKDSDYANILSTFKFSTVTASTTTEPGIQTFSIIARQSFAFTPY